MRNSSISLPKCLLILLSLTQAELNVEAQTLPMHQRAAVEQVVQINQEQIKAYERGDASTWGKHIAENCVFIDSVGRVGTKAEVMSGLSLPVGYTHTFQLLDLQAADFGSTIVLTYRIKELWDFGEQRTGGTNIHTAIFTFMKDDWNLISWTETLQPTEPKIVQVDPDTYDRYVGTYAANPKAMFTVTKENNLLMGQYAGEQKFELLPVGNSTFFKHGDNALFVFREGAAGKITEHIYRAPGIEITYKNVQYEREKER